MKTYRELYFKGNSFELEHFVHDIRLYAVGDWSSTRDKDRWKDYLFFDYIGDDVDKARVSIYIGAGFSKGELKVGNIIPLVKFELSVDEYNDILLRFYNDVIKPYKESGTKLTILPPSDDIFDPKSVISEVALKKLEIFCMAANKSTGSAHPLDKERWFDFICQTVDDGKMFSYSDLEGFLKDEDYWGTKTDEFIGPMGEFAWDDEQAYELASEYEKLCEILIYYKKLRGI